MTTANNLRAVARDPRSDVARRFVARLVADGLYTAREVRALAREFVAVERAEQENFIGWATRQPPVRIAG